MPSRTIIAAVSILVAVLAILLLVKQCDKRRSEGAQTRVERSQVDAASNSAADAIGTVRRSGEAEKASEELTRENERSIRQSQGANERVGAGVNAAGRKALCRREAYRHSSQCA